MTTCKTCGQSKQVAELTEAEGYMAWESMVCPNCGKHSLIQVNKEDDVLMCRSCGWNFFNRAEAINAVGPAETAMNMNVHPSYRDISQRVELSVQMEKHDDYVKEQLKKKKAKK